MIRKLSILFFIELLVCNVNVNVFGQQSTSLTGAGVLTGGAKLYGQSNTPSSITSNSTCGLTGGGFDGPAALPLVYLCSAEINTPRTIPTTVTVSPGGLQAAYNAAPCGADLQLTPGLSYTLTTAAGKGCPDTNWIWIRTVPSVSLPLEGVTQSPCYANVTVLADYPNFNCTSLGTHCNCLATITVAPGANINATGMDHVRLENVVVAKTTGAFTSNLILLTTANNVVIDRVWFHGNPGEELTRALFLDGASSISIVDSFFSDIHNLQNGSAGGDSQNLETSTAPGPFKVSHNFLSAGDEQIELGGGAYTYGTPSDIEVSYNHAYRPFTWNPGCTGGICPGGVNYNGGTGGKPYSVKNNFECKNCNRVLLFGNIWEDVWVAANQVANSTTLTPKNQANVASNLCPQCFVTNVTERFDQIVYSGMPFQIANVPNGNGAYATAGNSYSFHDVLANHILYSGCGAGCAPQMMAIATATAAPLGMYLNNVTWNHVTFVQDTFTGTSMMEINGPISPIQQGLTIENSIIPSGNFGVAAFGGGGCNVSPAASTPKLVACWNPFTFTQNGIPNAGGTSCSGHGCGGTWNATTGSLFLLADQNAVGYTNLATGNYLLLPSSPLHNQSNDIPPRDLGADITTLNSFISLVP